MVFESDADEESGQVGMKFRPGLGMLQMHGKYLQLRSCACLLIVTTACLLTAAGDSMFALNTVVG